MQARASLVLARVHVAPYSYSSHAQYRKLDALDGVLCALVRIPENRLAVCCAVSLVSLLCVHMFYCTTVLMCGFIHCTRDRSVCTQSLSMSTTRYAYNVHITYR